MSHVKYESTHGNINRWKINNLRRSCNFVPAQRSLYIIRSSAALISGYYQETGWLLRELYRSVSLLLIMARETCL